MASRCARNLSVLTQKRSLAAMLHEENQYANLQHCFSQEKQHRFMRTMFATSFTSRGQWDVFVCVFFELCGEVSSHRAPQEQWSIFCVVARLCFSVLLSCGQFRRVILAPVEVQGQIQWKAFFNVTLKTNAGPTDQMANSFCIDVVSFFI